jgi:serine/threonine-protein kinase
MEYIEGARITDHARDHRMDLAARIRLFLPVCTAVDYAHRNFIVHRDLKPGNIMVDRDGVPKLLDFGICKLLYSDPLATSETVSGMLTPEYASPEQVRGDQVTVSSDVYSLGAVLYELLTGVRPHRLGKTTPRAIEEAICERDVLPPSAACADGAVARRLRGDLDHIILHALAKDSQRRYESAAALAADLRRYLAHEPVLARPQTLTYQAAKFARRNRGARPSTIGPGPRPGQQVRVRRPRRGEGSARVHAGAPVNRTDRARIPGRDCTRRPRQSGV